MAPQRPVLSLLLALAMIGAGGTASALASPGEAADRTPETPIQDQTQTGNGSASNASNATAGTIFTPQQSYGATVTADVENLSDGGFVVIRRENNDGAPIIGVSRYLAPGSYEDVRIRLFEVPGRNFSQSRLEEDQELIAMLHRDSDGDRQFDFVRTDEATDEPLTQNGSVVQNPANVTVVGTAALARTQPTADLSFTAQSAPNGTVTVRSANLSTGGFVVIHRGDGVSGPIIGVSRRLAPGSHEDVQVELFNVSGQEFSRTDLGRSQVLTATAYLDTNNNSRFDYVRTNGSTDFPYLRTGSVVTDPSTINVTNSTTVSS
jgi:hypothetical protein